MQLLEPVAHAQHLAELAKAPLREAIPAGETDVFGLEAIEDAPHAIPVVRITLVVGASLGDCALVGRSVDVVGVTLERREPARQKRGGEAFRRLREVVDDAEAAEALPEHAPGLGSELVPDQLGVADDRVGPEVRQVFGLLLCAAPGEVAHGRRAAGAALVEKQHAVVLERAGEPGLVHELKRAWRLAPGASLEEHEPRQLVPLAVSRDDFAREDSQLSAFRARVVEWNVELVLAEDEVRSTVGGDAHHPILLGSSPERAG